MFLNGYRFCNHVIKERIMKLLHIVATGVAAAAVVSSAPLTTAFVGGALLGAAALAVRNSTAIMESGTDVSTGGRLPISGEGQRSPEPYSQTEHRLLRVIRSAGKQDLTEMKNDQRLRKRILTEQKGCLEKKVNENGECEYTNLCDSHISVQHNGEQKPLAEGRKSLCFEKKMNNGVNFIALDDVEVHFNSSSPRRHLKLQHETRGSGETETRVKVKNTGKEKLSFQFKEVCGGEKMTLEPGEVKRIPDIEPMCASHSQVKEVRRH